MLQRLIPTLALAALTLPGLANADELTKMVQQDLVTLGYEPGNTNGDATTQTIVAVSTFQAEHDLPVTGEITPQLAGVIKAAISKRGQGATAPAAAAAAAVPLAPDPAAQRVAEETCLRQLMADAQESEQKKRGLRSLARAVSRTSSQFGNSETSRRIGEAVSEVSNASAIASDLRAAARDLGVAEDEIGKCSAPQ